MKQFSWFASWFLFGSVLFLYGVGVGKYRWFPYKTLVRLQYLVSDNTRVTFDDIGRLTSTNLHVEIQCPKQTEALGVLVAFGQSNSANHAKYRYKPSELEGVINYFDGRCYEARSPLLGASSARGEWISKTARKLIENGTYQRVIVVSPGIGGTPIARWARGNDLNRLLLNVLAGLTTKYTVTDMIWHQGEADRAYTFTDTYENLFRTMVVSIRELGIDAPIFISVASICGKGSNYPNRITRAQQALSRLQGIELGANTDELVPMSFRYDQCHFGLQGQEAAATRAVELIRQYHWLISPISKSHIIIKCT